MQGRFLPATVLSFLKLYLVAVLFFALFRFVLFCTELNRLDASVSTLDVLHAFWMGVRFDLVISGYILTIPYFLLTVLLLFRRNNATLTAGTRRFVGILFSLAFLICAIDIPYFNHFFSRLTISLFEWFDSPVFVAKMILEEPRYWLAAVPLALVLYFFLKWNRRIFDALLTNSNNARPLQATGAILFLGLMLIGIRGRLEEKSPIRVGTAAFSNNAFLNQLGLNPNFTLIRSWLDSRKTENRSIRLMDEQQALRNVREYLHADSTGNPYTVTREIRFDSAAPPCNVVLVIMESMSAAKMTRHGNPNRLTPFLDSLSNEGIYFENAYSAGIHTFNGIFSTLFGYPALFRQHPMKESGSMQTGGIFHALKQHGYSTAYFTTHDGQFDNVEGFLRSNDCDLFISKPDYPAEQVKTTLGVPDDYMFEYAIPKLNELHEQKRPFVAAFMTASDHGPYYMPPYFKPRSAEIRNQIVEYADYSLRKLVDLASKQPWFGQTIFVFVADHGAALDGLYDMSISYNHSPLLFYAPQLLTPPRTDTAMAGQIDVFPSIMGLLRLPYANNSLGIDLFREKRPWIFFGADDKYGVMDQQWFLIVRSDGSKSLHRYRDRDTRNYAAEYPDLAKKMDDYARSNLQAYQSLLLEKNRFR